MEISSISAYEMVSLEASFTAMVEKGFDCKKRALEQLQRYEKDGMEITETQRARVMNCPLRDKEVSTNNVVFGKGSCFCKCKNPNFSTYLTLYDQFDKGTLPDNGPLLDQPAQIIEVLRYLKMLQNSWEEEERVKQQKQMKASNRAHRNR